jgi:redox-sensitive bicupin YhaK (pirin superfamily)
MVGMITVLDAKKPPGAPGSSHVLAAPIGPDGALRTVGPFALVAHAKMPVSPPGSLPVDADVRPHPHIGLTAISYILEGAVTHRDSLGNRCELHAGDMGATVSGRGVVHSERFERNRLLGSAFEMFQLLLGLPDGYEEVEPTFFFRTHQELSTSTREGVTERWLFPSPPQAPIGMPTTTPILLADVALESNGRWPVPDVPERALYVLHGEVEAGASRVRAGQVAVVGPGDVSVRALESARVLAFGGTSIGVRYVWWNYMHSSLERIEAAKAEWRHGRVKLPSGDTESFTPCPPDDGRPLWRMNG